MALDIRSAGEYIAAEPQDRAALLDELGEVAMSDVSFLRGEIPHPEASAQHRAWTIQSEAIFVEYLLKRREALRRAFGIH